jgi:hypothetical protein
MLIAGDSGLIARFGKFAAHLATRSTSPFAKSGNKACLAGYQHLESIHSLTSHAPESFRTARGPHHHLPSHVRA